MLAPSALQFDRVSCSLPFSSTFYVTPYLHSSLSTHACTCPLQLDDITSMLFGGRYCILLMAIYSMYTGALYNECFSIPMALFGNTRFG